METPKTATVPETEEQSAADKKKAEKAAAAAAAEAKAKKAATARAREKALEEAAGVLGRDVVNSAQQLTTACIHDHVSVIKDQWALLEQRVQKAKALIKSANIDI